MRKMQQRMAKVTTMAASGGAGMSSAGRMSTLPSVGRALYASWAHVRDDEVDQHVCWSRA
jgi:hypothetical protein